MRFGRVFGLIEYEKVLLMDADLLVTELQNDKIVSGARRSIATMHMQVFASEAGRCDLMRFAATSMTCSNYLLQQPWAVVHGAATPMVSA